MGFQRAKLRHFLSLSVINSPLCFSFTATLHQVACVASVFALISLLKAKFFFVTRPYVVSLLLHGASLKSFYLYLTFFGFPLIYSNLRCSTVFFFPLQYQVIRIYLAASRAITRCGFLFYSSFITRFFSLLVTLIKFTLSFYVRIFVYLPPPLAWDKDEEEELRWQG